MRLGEAKGKSTLASIVETKAFPCRSTFVESTVKAALSAVPGAKAEGGTPSWCKFTVTFCVVKTARAAGGLRQLAQRRRLVSAAGVRARGSTRSSAS